MSAWRVLGETVLADRPPFARFTEQRVELPDGRRIDSYLQIALRDFTVVVPQLEDGRVAVLHQYKHGLGEGALTFPGGLIEPGENPAMAARRELHEETGLAAGALRPLGAFTVNGNYGCGRAHLFHATGCVFVAPASPDDLEDTRLYILSRPALRARFADGLFATLPHAAAYGLSGV